MTPRWVRATAQPISIDDVVTYLLLALDLDEDGSAVYEIGGPQRLSYGQLMHEYARRIGVRRLMIPVPFLTPRISGLWLGLVGWYFATWLWALRGGIDRLLGGVGMRRGRRHPAELRPGDPLDFWRVEAFEAGRLLRLRAEMKLPGRAWLQFEVESADGGSRLTQTAVFDPPRLGGLLYWYGLYPVHWLIFRGMLRGIVRRAGDPSHSRSPARPPAGA